MNSSASTDLPDEAVQFAGKPRVVVAYEDYAACKRAEQAVRELLQPNHNHVTRNVGLWKFEMLELRAMRAAASEETAGVDLLVIAPKNGAELPMSVQEWVRVNLAQPSRPKALLVLAGLAPQEYEQVPPVESQLQQIAAQVRCPYWCLHLEPPEGKWSEPAYPDAALEQIAQAVFG